ncbi:PKD domain-containing protein [Cytophagaceae bacterium AH-315-L13]|nr:PKD domain-containing protein [Cytophagaceae bacterium AH-315-L13]
MPGSLLSHLKFILSFCIIFLCSISSVSSGVPLSGTYTIGGTSPDYNSITDAVTDLNNLGVSGPVIFEIRDQLFNEQVTIDTIVGSSQVNTVTFRSEDSNSDGDFGKISYTASGASDNYTFRILRGDYINIETFELDAKGTTYARVLVIDSNATHININGCKIYGVTSNGSSTNTALIYSRYGGNSNNLFIDNQLVDGSYGIYYYGPGADSIRIEYNIFKDQKYYGIYLYDVDGIKVNGNIIQSTNSTFAFTGLLMTYCDSACEITKNFIEAGLGWRGIVFTQGKGGTSKPSLIGNNMIHISDTAIAHGIYIEDRDKVDLYHNSINITSTDTNSACLYVSGSFSNKILVKNNNFTNLGGGYAYDIRQASAMDAMNYNNLYVTGINIGYYNGLQGTVADWRTATGREGNSIAADPMFRSSIDLHVKMNSPLIDAGVYFPPLFDDIDGDIRNNPPTIGADEFVLQPITYAFIPDTNFRKYLQDSLPALMKGDSLNTDSAATYGDYIRCDGRNISDLTGIEYFTNIYKLECSNNNLSSLPDLSTELYYLLCTGNNLDSLPNLSNNIKLINLICYNNNLTSIPDLSANVNLQNLWCQDNDLDKLPPLINNTALTGLDCGQNNIKILPDLSNNTSLTDLWCAMNSLKTLPDISGLAQLNILVCYDNDLYKIPDFSGNTNLSYVEMYDNRFDFSDAKNLQILNDMLSPPTFFYEPQKPFGWGDTIKVLNDDSTAEFEIERQDSALSYQWFLNGNLLPGETDTIISFLNAIPGDSGIYQCVSYGTALDSSRMVDAGIDSFISRPFYLMVIDAAAPCSALFKYTLDTGNSKIVYFEDSSYGVYDQFNWNFGDGTFSDLKNPEHAYDVGGNYEVCLTIYEPVTNCSDQYCELITIPDTDTTICYTKAVFTGTKDTATRIVTLTNLSEYYNQTYWDFGDGETSSQTNPSHQYIDPGFFEICLTVYNDTTECMSTICGNIFIKPKLIELLDTTLCILNADFNFVTDSTFVQFNDESSGFINNRFWEFGDGYSSSLRYPHHTYDESGNYEVCLTVSNDTTGCMVKICKTVTIIIDTSVCISDFQFFYLADDTVKFRNISIGNFTRVYWDLGDGTVSNLSNPKHKYVDYGDYDVCLTVFNDVDSCIDQSCQIVEIIDTTVVRCDAYFTYIVDSSTNTVTFNDQSSDSTTYWYWNFDDFSVANINRNPVHTFSNSGYYEVCLTIYSGSDCKDTYCEVVTVGDVSNDVYANFSAFADSLTATAFFKNKSYGQITQYNWEFGDGIFTNFKNPSHYYADTGRYLVCLTVENAGGASDFKCKYIEVGNSLANACELSCVWPGDANHDLDVNHYDLIALGLNFNRLGPRRDSTSFRRIGHFANSWDSEQITGINNKHSDCDGDGEITLDDIKAIRQNFGFSHPFKPGKTSSSSYNPSNPDLYFDILTNDIAPGVLVEISVMMGRDTIQSGVYGIGFELKLDANDVVSNSVSTNYDANWLGVRDTNLMTYDTTDYASGFSYISLAKNDQTNSYGYGELVTMAFTIDSNLTKNDVVIICLTSDYAMDANGDTITVNSGYCDTLKLTDSTCLPPVSSFGYQISGLTVDFSDSSSNADSWRWDYGDGDISTSQNPKHTYTDTGTYDICLATTNDCDKDTICKSIYISGTDYLEEIISVKSIKIYPNPSTGIINFELPPLPSGNYELTITNQLGQNIGKSLPTNLENIPAGKHTIDLSTLPNGLYIIQISTDDIFIQKKIHLLK